MALEFQFACPLPNGIHARPASALEEVARNFSADILLFNDRSRRTANAKSVLAIVGADIRHDDPCRLSVSGPDAEDAMAAMSAFLRLEFPRCDEALPPAPTLNGADTLPPALRLAGARIRHGAPAVHGIGHGRIVQSSGLRVPNHIPTTGEVDFAAEVRKLDAALTTLVEGYEERLTRHASPLEMDLLKAHRAVARDPEFRARLHAALREDHRTAAGAIAETEAHFTATLLASESALLRERVLDIQDVCHQLLCQTYGKAAATVQMPLAENSVVVAETLTPGQFLGLDRQRLKGLVLGHASGTSHTVILARSFGVPTLTGVEDLAGAHLQGEETVVDAEYGLLVTDLSEPARRYYAMEERRLEERQKHLRRFARQRGATSDGYPVRISANIATAEEAEAAFEAGAEGIGLFRTEMLFLDRDEPPGEDEQYEEYRRTLLAAGDRPVIIRTVDLGGDKLLSYLNLPAEDNPFLGYRAVRIYPEFEMLFRIQIRALLRAAEHGQLKVMIPMVTTLDEVRWARRIIREEQDRLIATDGYSNKHPLPVGAMIEVPAAAFVLDRLCGELDFFSIGSNDLLQYFSGTDRANPRLAGMYDPLHPGFLRLLKKIVEDARSGGRPIGVCGEMGGETRYLPLLVGLGLSRISVAPSLVAAVKAELTRWSVNDCRELTQRALSSGTAGEVRRLIEDCTAQRSAPLVVPELVMIESDSATKEEAIKTAVDRLFVLGRTEQPSAVERAVWDREAVYSTGFGHGFAIPHCKTNAVAVNSISVLKLPEPVPWGGLDELPVRVVLLLTVRESDQADGHLRIFSTLARRVMHEDFRERIAQEQDPVALCAFLKESIGA